MIMTDSSGRDELCVRCPRANYNVRDHEHLIPFDVLEECNIERTGVVTINPECLRLYFLQAARLPCYRHCVCMFTCYCVTLLLTFLSSLCERCVRGTCPVCDDVSMYGARKRVCAVHERAGHVLPPARRRKCVRDCCWQEPVHVSDLLFNDQVGHDERLWRPRRHW